MVLNTHLVIDYAATLCSVGAADGSGLVASKRFIDDARLRYVAYSTICTTSERAPDRTNRRIPWVFRRGRTSSQAYNRL